jgi:hypothetical protein
VRINKTRIRFFGPIIGPACCVCVPHYSFIYVACIPVGQLSLFRGVIIKSPRREKWLVVKSKSKNAALCPKSGAAKRLECCFARRQKQSGLQCHTSFVGKDDFCGFQIEFLACTVRLNLLIFFGLIQFLSLLWHF